VIDRSNQIINGLNNIKGIENIRNSGLIMAFDIQGQENFKNFVKKTKSCGMIFNSSGDKTVRLRPNLNLNEKEADKALNIIELSLES
jgi:acetylornithine/succinyldiaminopimelate/putrescine aminotransferase